MKKLILGAILAAAAAMSQASDATVYDTRTSVVGSEVVVEVVNSETGVVAETKRFHSTVLATAAGSSDPVVEEVASLSEDSGSLDNNSSSDVTDDQPSGVVSGGIISDTPSEKEVTAYEYIAVAAKEFASAVYNIFHSEKESAMLSPDESYKKDLPVIDLPEDSSVVDEDVQHEPVVDVVEDPDVKIFAL